MSNKNLIFTNKDKCIGCTNCSRRCPTEAIRVKDGKAVINLDRCIYCGECLRACPHHANYAIIDKLDIIYKFDKRIAIPDPALFAQFRNVSSVEQVMQALKLLGFNDVINISRASKIISMEEKRLIQEKKIKPLISSSCPAVSRLIQTRFPGLIDNLIKIESIFELTAKLALDDLSNGEKNKTGIFFITPCIAKAAEIKKPFYTHESNIDGVIAISDIYSKLVAALSEVQNSKAKEKISAKGIDWAVSGGEAKCIGYEKSLWVDGVYNVINIFEQVELDKLEDIDFIEAAACTEGCIGGALTVENIYIAKSRINKIVSKAPMSDRGFYGEDYKGQIAWNSELEYKPVMKLDIDFKLALKKLEELEAIHESLPRLDCGACGAPTCRALAEDIVRCLARKEDCVVESKIKKQTISIEKKIEG